MRERLRLWSGRRRQVSTLLTLGMRGGRPTASSNGTSCSLDLDLKVGVNPTVTLEKQLLNMIGKPV
jgi:hypothetical protein